MKPAGRARRAAAVAAAAIAVAIAAAAGWAAARLPRTSFVASASGWTVLLVTTAAMAASLRPALRRLAQAAEPEGTFLLYAVLASAGAQGHPGDWSRAMAWLGVGGITVAVHAASLAAFGRWRRIPLRLLAIASQANLGGLVSAPLVGAVYRADLAAVGLLLAVGCNAVGTYAGLIAAAIARAWTGSV